MKPEIRKEITENLKEYTNLNGIHAINQCICGVTVQVEAVAISFNYTRYSIKHNTVL